MMGEIFEKMEKQGKVDILYGNAEGHNTRYVTFYIFTVQKEALVNALEKVFPDKVKVNGRFWSGMAIVEVEKALTQDARKLSSLLPKSRVYATNSWSEVENVTMKLFVDGKRQFKGYHLICPEERHPEWKPKFGEYDEDDDSYFGILTILDDWSGMEIDFGNSAVSKEEIDELRELIKLTNYSEMPCIELPRGNYWQTGTRFFRLTASDKKAKRISAEEYMSAYEEYFNY